MIDAYLWWWPMMADVAASDKGDGVWISVGVIAAVGGAIAAVVKAFKAGEEKGAKEEKGKQKVDIANNPLPVKMEDHFVTRREFDTFKSEIRNDVTDIKGLFGRLTDKFDERDKRYQDKIEERDSRLSAKIEAVASGAYEARRRIHEKVNDQGERLKSLEDRTPLPPKRGGGN